MTDGRHDQLTVQCRQEAALAWRAPGLRVRDGSVRLFESRVAEALTSSPPYAPYVLVLPLVAWLGVDVARAAVTSGQSTGPAVVTAAALGALTWTLVEYLMHRFLFHFPARGEAGLVTTFLVHGHHHVHPHDPRRIAATPIQFGSLLLLFFGIVRATLSAPLAHAALAGVALGYLGYEWAHWVAHHGKPRTPWMRALKRHHLRHHFERPDARFGISTPVWDVVFRTLG